MNWYFIVWMLGYPLCVAGCNYIQARAYMRGGRENPIEEPGLAFPEIVMYVIIGVALFPAVD